MKLYQKVIQQYREIAVLESLEQVLNWDTEVNLKRDGYRYRGEQTGFLAKQLHKRLTDRNFVDRVDALLDSSEYENLSYLQKQEILFVKRKIDLETKIPVKLREGMARIAAIATGVWKEAKHSGDYTVYLRLLEKLIQLAREYCEYKGYKEDPYDALLDDYDRGLTYRAVNEWFSTLVPELQRIIAQVKEIQCDFLFRRMEIGIQRKICEVLVRTMELDENKIRLDESTHPFTATLGLSDVRITTNYDPFHFTGSIFSTLHEGGHAVYELGGQTSFGISPCGSITSMALHESQSRFFENCVGRSQAFIEYFFPMIRSLSQPILDDVCPQEFYHAVNQIYYTPIRVNADEVYYNLHIALRTELEHQLINGDLRVSDLNDCWNEQFRFYFHKEIFDKREGYLQDIHWVDGLFGYFPTYTMGNLIAAQLAETLQEETGIFSRSFTDSSFSVIRQWLQKSLYSLGNILTSGEAVRKITGRELSSEALICDLKKRYCSPSGSSE